MNDNIVNYPIERKYYISGIRPIRFVSLANGDLYVLRFNWETGVFEPGLEYLAKCSMGDDEVDEFETKEEFIQYLEGLRARRIKGEGELFELYQQMSKIEDKAKTEERPLNKEESDFIYQTRFKTFEMFTEQFEMGQPWSDYL
jgi:hypothetical protein